MDELVSWLRAVLDSDGERLRRMVDDWQPAEEWDSGDAVDDLHEWRWRLADIASKRAALDAIEHNRYYEDYGYALGDQLVAILASAYANWPGYRAEWAPETLT